MSIVSSVAKAIASASTTIVTRPHLLTRTAKRSFVHLTQKQCQTVAVTAKKLTQVCSCGCGQFQGIHTKGDKELLEFLHEEIGTEKKNQKMKVPPTSFEGFDVKYDGAEVTLTKKFNDEEITINYTVNHTVDTEMPEELNPNADQPETGEMKSKPTFEVDVVKNGKTIGFTCSYVQQQQEEGELGDVFGIDEVTFYEGEWKDSNYSVSGDILDGYLYDLLMNYLEERGISNEFAEKLSNCSTGFEHKLYIDLLENVQKFVSGK